MVKDKGDGIPEEGTDQQQEAERKEHRADIRYTNHYEDILDRGIDIMSGDKNLSDKSDYKKAQIAVESTF